MICHRYFTAFFTMNPCTLRGMSGKIYLFDIIRSIKKKRKKILFQRKPIKIPWKKKSEICRLCRHYKEMASITFHIG